MLPGFRERGVGPQFRTACDLVYSSGISPPASTPLQIFVTMNLGAKLSVEITVATIVQWALVGAVAAIYKPAIGTAR